LSFVQAVPPSAPVLAVTVTISVPALVQVSVGEAVVVPLNVPAPVPPVTAQVKPTCALLPALSTP